MTYSGKERRQFNGEMERVAKEAGRSGARECLLLLGADVENPLKMQADFQYIRAIRESHEAVGKTVRRTAIATVVTGGFVGAWLILKDFLPLGN